MARRDVRLPGSIPPVLQSKAFWIADGTLLELEYAMRALVEVFGVWTRIVRDKRREDVRFPAWASADDAVLRPRALLGALRTRGANLLSNILWRGREVAMLIEKCSDDLERRWFA